jgi:cation transporter-like permease
MSTTALGGLAETKPGRKQRAAKTVDAALRGGILAGAVAAIAWLLAVAIGGTVFFVLVVATVLALIYTVMRGDKANLRIWGLIAVAWALVLAERWVVNDNGGIIVAGAAWLGIVLGARRAGIAKKSLVLLLYPLISLAIVLGASESVLDPWGVSWLWVLAIIGPVLGARTMLNPSPRETPRPS